MNFSFSKFIVFDKIVQKISPYTLTSKDFADRTHVLLTDLCLIDIFLDEYKRKELTHKEFISKMEKVLNKQFRGAETDFKRLC